MFQPKANCSLQPTVILLIFFLNCIQIFDCQVLNPPYFNIAEGRNITASDTCGENVPEPELYCKIVGSNWLDESDNFNLIEGQACDYCDPSDPKKAHPPQFAIDGTERWWQSPPLSRGSQYTKVNLTLDLGQEFNVAYVFIKMGNSPRPGVWILERSRDYGKTYTPWQYFADTPQDCSHFFGKHTLQPITRDDSVICETKFSKLVPLENGEIAISLINGRPSADNFSMSTTLQEWTTATNIRLRFLRPKTTLGHFISVAREEPTVTRRVSFAWLLIEIFKTKFLQILLNINIGGQCVCNGHASQCDQNSPADPLKLSCACQHHTCGWQCEKCCNGYQQYEWRRATVDDPFVCEKCNCHGHSNDCYFDAEVQAKNQSKNIHGRFEGGGICTNCQHNTTGINCDKCRDGFYRPKDKSLDAIDVCQPCQCDPKFSTGNCFDETAQCECKKNFKSPDCDECNIGYFGFPECQECHCYGGKYCKECQENYYGFPSCQKCKCNLDNSYNNSCNIETGQCHCLSNFGGVNCDECNIGFKNYPKCESCQCALEGTNEKVCDNNTGECFCREGYEKPFCDKCAKGYYGFPNCIKCDCNLEGSTSTACDKDGKCECKSNFGGLKCNDCAVGSFNFPKCEQCRCHWRGSSGISCDHSGNCLCLERYEGQKCDQCKEGYYNFPYCEECNCNPAGLVAEFGGCDKVEIGKLCECKERVKGRICNQCKDLFWNLQMNNPYGCEDCRCNQNGTVSRIGICDTITGNCMCKNNVQGRTCDMCKPNTYLLDSANLFGCVDCQCDVGGSISSDCDKLTGQCRCKSRIKGKTCSETLDATYFPTFYQFQYETEDWFNPSGSPARFGYDEMVFPNYSWRGYAVFSPLQKEILTNITITKTSIYKVIVHYVSKNNETINGVLKFIPYEWMNSEPQTVSINMEPTSSPKLLYVTGRQLNGMVSLGVGPWQIFLQADKPDLYVDYIVLIPQAYYDPGLFQERITGPCLYLNSNNLSCILHSFPDFPESGKTLPASEAFVMKDSGQVKPPVIESKTYHEKLNENIGLVQMDNENSNLEFDFVANNNGTNILILNYHTPNNLNDSVPIQIELENISKNITMETDNILSACPYLFICRQAISTKDGRLLSFDSTSDDSFRLRIKLLDQDENITIATTEHSPPPPGQTDFKPAAINDRTLNVNKIVMIPLDNKWSFDYIEPSFVCLSKNDNCTASIFPTVADGIKVEAESEQKQDHIVQLPKYNQAIPIFEQKPYMVELNESMPSIDIRGSVPKPGPYHFVLNYYQPKNPKFNVDALIQNGHLFSGVAQLQHCPNTVGCRVALQQRDSESNSTAFNIQNNFLLTLKIPKTENIFVDRWFSPQPCKTGFYGWPDCKKCDCPSTAICHWKTGDCICPKGVTGKDCDKCLPLTFGFDKIIGCEDCACDPRGVLNRDLRCDLDTGDCKCKQNIVGRTCDKCRAGFFGFPKCQLCRCDIRGTTPEICDQNSARCFCKKNVDGAYCDHCKSDSYFLEESNSQGCTKCFCFGNTDRCTGSSYVFVPITSNNIELELYNVSLYGQIFEAIRLKKNEDYELDYTNNIFSIRTSFGREKSETNPENPSSIYVQLPKEFLGNKISSYGGLFRYSILNKANSKDYEPALLMADIILIGRNHTLLHEHIEQPVINENFTVTIKLLEKEFKGMDGNFVTREQFMMTLVDIKAIYVRIKYFNLALDTVDIEFEFQMETAVPGNKIIDSNYRKATSVEQCLCPSNYRGASCEECAEGYYRVQQGPYLGACIPCNCNGHSNECDPITGQCFNCKFNTKGDHCEQCTEGYYGDATLGTPNDCLICACPRPIASNNCEVDHSGSVLGCDCKEGYNGTRCEFCGAGHYGNPQIAGQSCQKCECNNNIDVKDPESCDPFTGICNKCLFNSSGEHCERCADWHWGDSIISKNCTECDCNQCGAEYCDHKTSSCKCKMNVIGEKCDRCAPGFYGFSTCNGCQPCNCGEASNDFNCDDSGQCPCKTGAAGKTCGTCAPGFWDYSKYGCTSCGCNENYSRVKQCNQLTGQCQCLPGVVGAKCEKCPDRWVLIPESGCQECGDCIHTLLDDTDQINENIIAIESQTQNTSSSILQNRKLNNIKERMDSYAGLMNTTFDESNQRANNLRNFTTIKKDSEDLLEDIEKIDIKSDSFEENTDKVLVKVMKALNDSLMAENKVKSVRQLTVQAVENINQLENSFNDHAVAQNLGSINESEQILQALKRPYIDNYMERFNIDLGDFQETLESSENFFRPWSKVKEDISMTKDKLGNFFNLIVELKNLTNIARRDAVEAERVVEKRLNDSIQSSIVDLNDHLTQAITLLQDADQFINKSNKNFGDLENMRVDIEQQKDRLNKEMETLNRFDKIAEEISEIENVVIDAEKHAKEQKFQSNYLNEFMASTKNKAMDPLKAANAYDNISRTIEANEEIVRELKEKLQPFQNDPLSEDLDKSDELFINEKLEQINNSTEFLKENEMMINEISKVIDEKTDQFQKLNHSLMNLESIDPKTNSHEKIKDQVDQVYRTESQVNKLRDLIDNLKNKSKEIKDYSDFVNDIKEGKDYVDRFDKDVERTKNITTSDDINDLTNEFNKIRSTISNKISDLKKRIQLARHQANNMRIGVRLNENSLLELNNPSNLIESSTYNKFSMYFQPLDSDGILAYVGNPADIVSNELVKRETVEMDPDAKSKRKQINHDYFVLELRRGQVYLIWDLGTGQPLVVPHHQQIVPGTWNQIIVERFGRLIRMSLKINENSAPIIVEKEASGSASVFNLDRENSKIYIGNIPPNVPVSSNIENRRFRGDISDVYLDNEPLGLWNARESQYLESVPGPEMFIENALRFNGNSYVIMARNNINFKETVYVSFQFKTLIKNGLLFLVGDPNRKVFFSIELVDGQVVVKYDLGSSYTTVVSNDRYNDGKWHFIKVNREGKECLINVDNNDEQSGFSMGLSTDLHTDDHIYIGGFKGILPYYDVGKEGFDGCLKDLQIDSNQQNLNNHKESFGVNLGCSTFVRIVSFAEAGKSHIVFENQTIDTLSTKNNVQIAFKFRTLAKIGLLWNYSVLDLSEYVSLFLYDGMLILKMSNGQELRTDNQFYNDNKWHYLTINFNKRILEMDVDDINSFSLIVDSPIDLDRLETIYIGGMPFESLYANFVGCIGDVTVNYKFLNFADSNSMMNALFKKCPLAINDDEFDDNNFRDLLTPETYTKAPDIQYLPPIKDCKLAPIPQPANLTDSDPNEKRFGGSLWSRYEFPMTNEIAKGLEGESGFQIQFKTSQAEGIIFYITSSNNIDFIGLYFLNNKLYYSFDCGSGRGVTMLPNNYSDNVWHTATFSRKGRNGLLRVDEETVEVTSVGSTSSLNVKSPIYIGGIPKELRSQIKGHLKSVEKNDYNYAMVSFSGCLKDLKVRDIEYNFKDGREFDVAPCSPQNEYGHFFHYDGGYIRLFDEFRVRVQFTLILEIKPRKPDGILAAVFGSNDYLVLYMDKGDLVFSVDNGAVPITAKGSAKGSICDGEWHVIKAIKTKNLVMLTVDDNLPIISVGQVGISSTDTKDPLYIGGLPEKLKQEKRLKLDNIVDDYLGCMRINSINAKPPTFNNAKIEGHITLNTCPID
ncbi:paramyosin-like protein 1, partial [Sarcoptes scabiei]